MPTVKSNLQKLENLVNSASSARQQKMYQSLLDKARKSDEGEQEAEVNTVSRIASPPKDKQQKKSTNKIKKKATKVSEQKTAKKAKQEIETSELKTTKKDKHKKNPVEQPENSSSEKDQNNQQSQKKGQDVFQAVGWITCLTQLRDDKLYATINDQQYLLKRGQWKMGKNFDNLKQEIEENGSQEKQLQVYPKVVHHPAKGKIDHCFTLVKTSSENSQTNNQQKDFILRGIWQQVCHCSQPVITVYRNIDMIHYYQRAKTPAAKKAFARPQDFPVVWNAPIKPFQNDSKLEKKEQMSRYFVQVRAIFKNGQFQVIEMLEEPTLDIPRYIKPEKK